MQLVVVGQEEGSQKIKIKKKKKGLLWLNLWGGGRGDGKPRGLGWAKLATSCDTEVPPLQSC